MVLSKIPTICLLITFCPIAIDAAGSVFDTWYACAPQLPAPSSGFVASITACIKTECTTFTIGSQNDANQHAAELDANGYFAKGRQVVYIVHGLVSNISLATWMPCMKDAICEAENSTVLIVDWSAGVRNYGYRQVASNTRLAAAAIKNMSIAIANTVTLKDSGLYLYCIGHSLGAHVCGQASRQYGKFNRTSALDPSGPGFDTCATWSSVQLKSSDAQCVDAIHTEGGGQCCCPYDPVPYYGSIKPSGQIDFYPNGGLAYQPNCNFLHCSHTKAIDYFIESIGNSTAYPSNGTCSNPNSLPGSCNNSTSQYMGYNSTCHKDNGPLKSGNFYLTCEVGTLVCFSHVQNLFVNFNAQC